MALVGDNGAGKSTLIKSIAGIHPIDSGEISFEGKPVSIHGPKDAARLGIEVVYQDLALCDNLDVVQNMYLGREAHDSLLRLLEPEMERQTSGTLATPLGDDDPFDPLEGRRPVGRPAAVGGRRTSSDVELEARDPRRAHRRARRRADAPGARSGRRLGQQGLAVILISHNLLDIFDVADRITVLRLGRNVAEFVRRETTAQEVVAAITGGTATRVAGITDL